MTADDLGFKGATKGSDWMKLRSEIQSDVQSGVYLEIIQLFLPLYYTTKTFENSEGKSHCLALF